MNWKPCVFCNDSVLVEPFIFRQTGNSLQLGHFIDFTAFSFLAEATLASISSLVSVIEFLQIVLLWIFY